MCIKMGLDSVSRDGNHFVDFSKLASSDFLKLITNDYHKRYYWNYYDLDKRKNIHHIQTYKLRIFLIKKN